MNGVTIWNEKKACNGYTLYAPTARTPHPDDEKVHPIYLIDMEGSIVHEWKASSTVQSYCQLLANGNLVYPTHDRSEVDTGLAGITELDPNSEVVWRYRCRTDHEFVVQKNGRVLIHTITENMWPSLGKEIKRHPYLVEINRDKELLWEWKGEEHVADMMKFLSKEQQAFVKERIEGPFAFDWAHNNTAQIIPDNETYRKQGASSPFRPGNIVFSYRSLDVIGVIDRNTSKIVWAWGPFVLDGQHKPHVLENGHILIFDNGTLRGYSRVIEMDPITDEIVWEYTADPKESFFSPYISSAQRLENGNTLICEGNKKRLFEVTAEGERVWEFTNPHPQAKESIYRCTRYTPEFAKALFDRTS